MELEGENSLVHEIYAFLPLTERLASAGQPTKEQFADIKSAGYDVIVNLVPPNAPNALPDEAQIVSGLGMDYVAIPVIWTEPQVLDAERFFAVMDANSHKKTFIHCAANMRVAAFMYLYRTLCQKVPTDEAAKDLHQIWVPNASWAAFIQTMISR